MDKFKQLVSDYIDGEISPEGELELAAVLEQEPEKRNQLAELYRIHRMLQAESLKEKDPAFTKSIMDSLDADSADFVDTVIGELEQKTEKSSKRTSRPVLLTRFIRLTAAAVIIVCALLLHNLLKDPKETRTGPVASFTATGDGVILIRDKAVFLNRKSGELEPGDRIESGAEQTAELLWLDKSLKTELAHSTALKIPGPGTGYLFVEYGKIRVEAEPRSEEQPLFIQTAQAVLEITGTVFTVSTEAESTKLSVSEGSVKITDTATRESAEVKSGMFAVASGKPGLAVRRSPAYTIPAGNLIVNSGFEKGIAGWTVQEGESGQLKINQSLGTAAEEEVYESGHSGRLKPGEAFMNALCMYQAVPWEAGKKLTVSGFVLKTDPDTRAVLNLIWLDKRKNKNSWIKSYTIAEPEKAGVWVKGQKTLTAPLRTEWVMIYLGTSLMKSTDSSSAVYFDGISVIPAE